MVVGAPGGEGAACRTPGTGKRYRTNTGHGTPHDYLSDFHLDQGHSWIENPRPLDAPLAISAATALRVHVVIVRRDLSSVCRIRPPRRGALSDKPTARSASPRFFFFGHGVMPNGELGISARAYAAGNPADNPPWQIPPCYNATRCRHPCRSWPSQLVFLSTVAFLYP